MKATIMKLLIGLALVAMSGSAFATLITMTPSSSTVNIGESFFVTVHGDAFPGTAGSTLGLTFNSGLIDFSSVTLAPGSPFTGGVFACIGPSCIGGAAITVLASFDGPPDPSGSFDAYQIHFTALGPGSANIGLIDNGVELGWVDSSDPNFRLLGNVAYNPASINIVRPGGTVPEPGTMSLVLLGLAGLGACQRRWSIA